MEIGPTARIIFSGEFSDDRRLRAFEGHSAAHPVSETQTTALQCKYICASNNIVFSKNSQNFKNTFKIQYF